MARRSGLNWLAGGAAGTMLVPALAVGTGMPFVVACAAGVLAGGGLVLLLAPATPFKALDASGAAKGKIEFARDLLTEAEPSAERLESAAKGIRADVVAERVHTWRASRAAYSRRLQRMRCGSTGHAGF
jgi:hypothetical protein